MAEGGGAGILREILAAFEISVDDKELEEADKKIEDFKGRITELVKVVTEAFAVDLLKEFVQSQVEAATELERTALRLGLTTEKLEEFNLAAGLAGVQSESFTIGLRFLSRNIGEAVVKGGDAAATFQRLGIHLKETDGTTRNTGDILEDLADKFASIPDAAKRTQLAMELFGRQGAALIPILSKGREAFAEARKEMVELGGGTSEAVIEGAKRIEEQQVRLNFAMQGLKNTIALALFPVFEKLISHSVESVKHLIDFTQHTYVLQTGLEALGAIAGFKAIQGLTTLLKTFGLLKPSILETAAALLEFAAPILIIGALYLIFDDLYTLMKGGQSVIGETLDQLFGIGTAASFVQFLNDAVTTTIDLFEGLAQILTGIVLPIFISLWEVVKGLLKSIVDLETLNFDKLKSDLADGGKAITEAWKAGGRTVVNGALQAVGLGPDAHPFTQGPQRGFGGTIGPSPEAAVREPTGFDFGRPEKGHVREPISVQFGPGAHPPGSVVHQTVQNKIDVHTHTDEPEAVGEAVGQGVSTSQERATSNALNAARKT